jgi:hypothetical protein
MRRRSVILRSSLVALLAIGLVGSAMSSGSAGPPPSGPAASDRLSTPDLIERAVRTGDLSRDRANLYLAYALVDYERVPVAYRSDVPYHGTALLLQLRRDVAGMPQGSLRSQVEALLDPDPGSFCDVLSPGPLPDNIESDHFYIEYDATLIGGVSGLTIDDYIDSLEHSWLMEIDSFGWWAPPVYEVAPPGGKYHVRIEPTMAPVLYGYVSNFGKYAGSVGDSPNTSWDDVDADASCMGLNNDYSNFPGSPRRALDATTAHEFNHSIQFGIGGLFGANEPDSAFVEGGATWMEDEAYDSSNDNYNYLWPTFEDDMGEYDDSPYPYWITFRGLTEPFGASVPGGGEDVMQRFWELTSRNEASNLDALNQALVEHGTTLAAAYHAYAIAVKFNKACGRRYVSPYCFEEGPQYVNGDDVQDGAGETEAHGTIASAGGSFSSSIPDNFSLNWVVLPSTGAYLVTLANTSAGGEMRGSLVCDTGKQLKIEAFPGVAGAGQSLQARSFRKGCKTVVAVITNQAQTASNPSSSVSRTYTLSTSG